MSNFVFNSNSKLATVLKPFNVVVSLCFIKEIILKSMSILNSFTSAIKVLFE